MRRVLIIGSGFVGRGIAGEVERRGCEAVLASRSPLSGPDRWVCLDVTDPAACSRVLRDVRPDAVIAVHGPSDVTWCQQQPRLALTAHRDATVNLVRAAGSTRLLMISTDNVFAGVAEVNDELTAIAPANAYGHAKRAAEDALEHHPDATVLRVSLVYGPEKPRSDKRPNFAAYCVRDLGAGKIVNAPVDQWTTPVHVGDVAQVTFAALAGAPRLLHLGGPERISRVAWAHRVADRLGVSRALVAAVPKDLGPYACRPTNSCLTSVLLPDLLKDWGVRIRGVDEGVVDTLTAWL